MIGTTPAPRDRMGPAGRAVPGWWSELDRFRASYTRPGSLVYTWHVNYRLGALVARRALPTGITPNQLTLAGMVGSLAVSLGISLVGRVTAPEIVAAVVGWQLAYSLDCADGQLARARGCASGFGAWLDQCADFVAHVGTLTALVVVIARSGRFDPTVLVAVGGLVVGANLLALFASSQFNALVLAPGPVRSSPPPARRGWITLLTRARHLVDYGAFLLAAGALLGAPDGLIALLAVAGAAQVGATAGQVILNWPRPVAG